MNKMLARDLTDQARVAQQAIVKACMQVSCMFRKIV
jgi:hypothetical protein